MLAVDACHVGHGVDGADGGGGGAGGGGRGAGQGEPRLVPHHQPLYKTRGEGTGQGCVSFDPLTHCS